MWLGMEASRKLIIVFLLSLSSYTNAQLVTNRAVECLSTAMVVKMEFSSPFNGKSINHLIHQSIRHGLRKQILRKVLLSMGGQRQSNTDRKRASQHGRRRRTVLRGYCQGGACFTNMSNLTIRVAPTSPWCWLSRPWLVSSSRACPAFKFSARTQLTISRLLCPRAVRIMGDCILSELINHAINQSINQTSIEFGASLRRGRKSVVDDDNQGWTWYWAGRDTGGCCWTTDHAWCRHAGYKWVSINWWLIDWF